MPVRRAARSRSHLAPGRGGFLPSRAGPGGLDGDHPRREGRCLGEDLAATCVEVQDGLDLTEPIGTELRIAPRRSLFGCSAVEPVESPPGHISRGRLGHQYIERSHPDIVSATKSAPIFT